MPKLLTYDTYTILAAGATKSFDVSEDIQNYNIVPDSGAVTLSANMNFNSTGTPEENDIFNFFYEGGVTTGAFAVNFFGTNLTTAQALYQQIITVLYRNSGWVVYVVSVTNDNTDDINGGDIVDGTVGNAKLAGNIGLTKIAVSPARGYTFRAGQSGVVETFNAITSGNLLIGDGVDLTSAAMSGDVTINGVGVTTLSANSVVTTNITDANITAAKLDSELRSEVLSIQISFESGEQAAYPLRMNYAGSIVNIYARAIKSIAGTDNGTVTIRDNAGTTMTVGTPIVFAASDLINTTYSSNVSGNNTFVAGDIITVTPVKATAGGKALIVLEAFRS